MLRWPPALSWTPESVGPWVAGLLTLAVLSTAFVENRASRAAFGLFIGAATGYVAAIIWRLVLWPRVVLVLQNPLEQWPLLVWFLLGLLLLTRGLASASWLSNVSLAYLIGVGVALAIGGAVLGTAVPQLVAVATVRRQFEPGSWPAVLNALLVAVGTGGVLFRFAYTGWGGKGTLGKLWARLVGSWGQVGNAFLLVAFGALFAMAIITLLSLLTSRLQFLLGDWLHLLAT